MSMITDQSLVVGLISDSKKAEEIKVLQEMKALGATTLAVVNEAIDVKADYVIELETTISDAARSALYLPLIQLMGFLSFLK